MNDVCHMLGASARFALLRALYYLPDAVGLRQLARLADVHPHSAERMLKELVDEGVVLRKKTSSRTMFTRSNDHSDWCVLEPVFDAAERSIRALNAPRLNRRAQAILPFLEEAGSMLKKARRSIRVA